MLGDYKDVRGRRHHSSIDAERANHSYEEETRRLHESGITKFDLGIVVVLSVLTYFLIAHQLPFAWKKHRMQEFFMYFGGTCASWYVWYLLLKIPVPIRLVVYTIALCVGLYVGNRTGFL